MDKRLDGMHVLVVEDEYLLAESLAHELSIRGARVVGPAATVGDALNLIARDDVQVAVIDLNLAGEMAFPVADTLVDRRVPLVFTTGYESASLPPRFAEVTCCQKPYAIERVVDALLTAR